MPVFSHSLQQEGKRLGSKQLIDHLSGVRSKAAAQFSGNVAFKNTADLKLLLSVVCWLHDLGKYTSYFQTYLLEPEKADYQLKSHSNLGAHTAFQYFQEDSERALIAFYLIKMHHSNLVNLDLVLFPDSLSSRMHEPYVFTKQKEALGCLEELKERVDGFCEAQIELSSPKHLYRLYKKHFRKQASIERYFCINYLFSLLIEADKLDASGTLPYVPESLPPNAVDDRFGKPVFKDHDLNRMSQDELRNYVRAEVINNLNNSGILKKRIFTLAAPTGIGKTMTALDFILKLRKEIEEKENYLPQIIYGLPFINIIEQSITEYEKTLGEGKVLGHYQYADIFGGDEESKNEGSDEVNAYSRKQMSWDTWQKDVVITSFVQLFETLIGSRNKLLKKFAHFADSIVILDEVQTLAIEKLPIIGATLFYAAKFLNTRILLMTATQPKIFELMARELDVKVDDPELEPFNLLRNDNKVFNCFNRTKIVPLLADRTDNTKFVALFNKYWNYGDSCIVVVNKVSRSIELFEELHHFLQDYEDVELFYLSTNIAPIERQERIRGIKEKLKEKTCILVSTQVVEAGVDLDFDMGFRDLGPIDSIVQVAGRINRENSEERKGSPLYIVDLGDCQKIYGVATDIKARKSLALNEIEEKDYKIMIETYFEEISDDEIADFSYSREIFDAMQNLKYAFPSSSPKKHRTVSDFKIIEESQNGISVFIESPEDKDGSEARKAYQSLLAGHLTKIDFDRKFKRIFSQRIIAVPRYISKIVELEREDALTENILWVQPEDYEYYYSNLTGFKRETTQANETITF